MGQGCHTLRSTNDPVYPIRDGGVTAATARIVATVSAELTPQRSPIMCAVLSSVARPLLIIVVCMCVI